MTNKALFLRLQLRKRELAPIRLRGCLTSIEPETNLERLISWMRKRAGAGLGVRTGGGVADVRRIRDDPVSRALDRAHNNKPRARSSQTWRGAAGNGKPEPG